MSRRFGAVFAGSLAFALTGCEPKLPPIEATSRLVYANPGWTHRDRQIYYYTPQGTELYGVRYSWFRNLELPFSDQRLADPALLSRLGFILDPHANPVANPAGLPIGITYHEDPKGGEALLDITCAACHTGQLHYEGTAIRIDGGQAMHAVASTKPGTFAFLLVTSLLHTYLDPFEFDRFAERVLGVEYPKQKKQLRDDLGRSTQKFIREGWHARHLYPTEDGFGRTDALGHIANAVFGDGLDHRNYREANAPVNYPHVWDIWKFDWVQWGGSVAQAMGRNVGEALGVKAPLELVGEYGSTLPEKDRFGSGVLVRELHCVESTLWQLQPPKWVEEIVVDGEKKEVLPPIVLEKAEAGKQLFDANCRRCHGPIRYQPKRQPTQGKPFEWQVVMVPTSEIGTDPLSAANFVQNRYDASTVDPSAPQLAHVSSGGALDAVTLGVILKKYAELRISPEERWWFDGFGRRTEVQVLRSYKARPLHGIWATPPFLHNGSVPSIYQLLLPEEKRKKKFWVGSREYDPVHLGYRTDRVENGFEFDTSIPGNANTGHQFRNDGGAGVIKKREFTDGERFAIIEYLKVLGNPDPRYEHLWREKGSIERWRDPRLASEIPCARLPNGDCRPVPKQLAGSEALRGGLPAPQCTSSDPRRPIQGPARLVPAELPNVLPKRTREAREGAVRAVAGQRSY